MLDKLFLWKVKIKIGAKGEATEYFATKIKDLDEIQEKLTSRQVEKKNELKIAPGTEYLGEVTILD